MRKSVALKHILYEALQHDQRFNNAFKLRVISKLQVVFQYIVVTLTREMRAVINVVILLGNKIFFWNDSIVVCQSKVCILMKHTYDIIITLAFSLITLQQILSNNCKRNVKLSRDIDLDNHLTIPMQRTGIYSLGQTSKRTNSQKTSINDIKLFIWFKLDKREKRGSTFFSFDLYINLKTSDSGVSIPNLPNMIPYANNRYH